MENRTIRERKKVYQPSAKKIKSEQFLVYGGKNE